jgi:hypothetical protein
MILEKEMNGIRHACRKYLLDSKSVSDNNSNKTRASVQNEIGYYRNGTDNLGVTCLVLTEAERFLYYSQSSIIFYQDANIVANLPQVPGWTQH